MDIDLAYTWLAYARHAPPLPLISEPNKVQQFQFQTSGILLSTGVQKLYESKTS